MRRLEDEELQAVERHLDEWGDAQLGGYDYAGHMLTDLRRYKAALEEIRDMPPKWGTTVDTAAKVARQALADDGESEG